MPTRPGYVWSGTEWIGIGQEAAVSPFKYQATAPSSPATGDIWIDSDDEVPGIVSSLNYRWRKIATGGETSISGQDDSGLPLVYNPGYEQVYINGVLQYRGSDYVATTGNTITGLTALVANDTIEVLSFVTAPIGDTYTQSVADGKFATQANFPAGAWTSYTPTLTGFTLGTGGTMTARYTKLGKTVHGYVNITLGTSFTMTDISLSLPIPKQATTTYVNAVWTLVGAGAGDWPAVNRYQTSDTIGVYAMNSNGTYVGPSFVSTTVPFTWKATDKILVAFTYEAA